MPAKVAKSKKRLVCGTRLLPKAISKLNRWRRSDERFSSFLARMLEELAEGRAYCEPCGYSHPIHTPHDLPILVARVRQTATAKMQRYSAEGNELAAAAARATGEEIAEALEGRHGR
jgi:hypothetical protein